MLMYQMIRKEQGMAQKYARARFQELILWKNAVGEDLQRGLIRPILSEFQVAQHGVALLDGIWLQAVEKCSEQQHIRQAKKMLTNYYELLKV